MRRGSTKFLEIVECNKRDEYTTIIGCTLASDDSKEMGLSDQSVIIDIAVVGFNLSNGSKHLLSVFTTGGFHMKYRANTPT